MDTKHHLSGYKTPLFTDKNGNPINREPTQEESKAILEWLHGAEKISVKEQGKQYG